MATCPTCGAFVPDNSPACTYCGTALNAAASMQQPENNGFEVPADSQIPQQPVQQTYQQPAQQPVQQPYAAPVYTPQPVAPVSTGGLIAWSIITILLCTIPGIVALVNTLNINKAMSVEEQQQKIKNAKLWYIIGTVLGVLAVIGSVAGGAA